MMIHGAYNAASEEPSTPAVSGVSGTIATGESITVSGTGFGTKSPAAPVMWADFESGAVEETAYCTGTLSKSTYTSIQTPTQPHDSVYVAGGMPNSTADGLQQIRINVTGSGSDHLYMFVRRYWDDSNFFDSCGDGAYNLKFARAHPVISSNYPRFLHQWAYDAQRAGAEYGDNMTPTGSLATSTRPPEEDWYTSEYVIYQQYVSMGGFFDLYQDGTQVVDMTLVSKNDAFQSDFGYYAIVAEPNGCYPPIDKYAYFDDFYADDTWARVMIGDASTLSSCTIREIQVPTAWSSTSITVLVNQGMFDSEDPAYLFVIDENNVASAGYAIEFD